ncbi:MAG: DciA family protein [Saprospiraceae bacterium]|nr:DciA family protein [Saprospiraceae bacterium]
MKEILSQLIKRDGIRQPLHEVEIRQIWQREMGDYVNKYTRYLRLRGHVLEIGISSAGLRDELGYAKKKITSFLNEQLGEEVIQDVVLRH